MSSEGQSGGAVCGTAKGSRCDRTWPPLEPRERWQLQVWLQALSGGREVGSGISPCSTGCLEGLSKAGPSHTGSSRAVTPCNVWHNSSGVQCWFSSETLCGLCMLLDVSLVLQLSATLPPVALVFVKCPCAFPLPIAGMLWK